MGKKVARPRTSERPRDAAGRWQPGHGPNPTGANQHGGLTVPGPDDLAVIEKMAAVGHAQRSIAKRCGVVLSTFQRWLKDYPEVKEAYENGLAAEHDTLVSGLAQQAAKGNIVAAIFLLKARHGYVEGQQVQDNRVAVQITLPGAMTQENYMKTVKCVSATQQIPSEGVNESE
jgi:hypothetical protein